MLKQWRTAKLFILSAAMFSAGVGAATVTISYLPKVTAASETITETKQLKPEQAIEVDGLKWEFYNCNRANKKVTCNIMVTNIGQKDRRVKINQYGSRIVDFSGKQYRARQASFGVSRVLTTLRKGVPTKVNLSFQLPQNITSFDTLQVDSYNAKILFRQINIRGSQAVLSTKPENNCSKQLITQN